MPSITDFALQNLRLTEDHPGVWIVTLNRPDKRNALNADSSCCKGSEIIWCKSMKGEASTCDPTGYQPRSQMPISIGEENRCRGRKPRKKKKTTDHQALPCYRFGPSSSVIAGGMPSISKSDQITASSRRRFI
jgi:hypothetical protein